MLRLSAAQKQLLKVIGNASRLKILLALWKYNKELRIYKICQFTGLGRSAVRRHIKVLIDAGLVSRKLYGEISLYSINISNSVVAALIEFFTKAKL